MPDRLARVRLWTDLRLLVLDVETAVAEDGGHRIVSIAGVSCRGGRITARWSHPLVDPGIPIDPITSSIHGLTDAHVAGAPTFAAIARELMPLLREVEGEVLVLAAHNVRFDITVIRDELTRVGLAMPDLPLLDTAGSLPSLAGVAPADRSLAALLAALRVSNPAPHSALADAEATARAASQLLDRAADAGHDRLSALLGKLGDGRVSTARPLRPGRGLAVVEPEIPAAHLAGHADPLPTRPGKRALSAWLASVRECASLRCGYLSDRIAATDAPSALILPPLIEAVEAQVAAAAAATLLGAIAPRLIEPPPVAGGRVPDLLRNSAVALARRLDHVSHRLGRCIEPLLCPACRVGSACPLDTWPLALAPAVLAGPVEKRAAGFFELSGSAVGDGPWKRLCANGDQIIADAGLRLVHRHYMDADLRDQASTLASAAIKRGCADPEIAEALALALARGGRPQDLDAALAVCSRTLGLRNDSTEEAWRSLAIRAGELGGRRRRLNVRFTDQVDADGNLVPVRRHHPSHPRRSRPFRFLRPAG